MPPNKQPQPTAICWVLFEAGLDRHLFKPNSRESRPISAATYSVVSMPEYTHLQGQYLAFIYNYTKINRCPPAEADMQRYFRVSPPPVHQMIVRLEENGFVKRAPGQARSIELLLPLEQLPRLE